MMIPNSTPITKSHTVMQTMMLAMVTYSDLLRYSLSISATYENDGAHQLTL